MSYFLAFAGFCVLIVLHEFGHFVAAKAVGMRVERFALFFPPLLFKIKRGETEYGVGAIPLGGYVRISGMTPHEELPPEVEHRAYYKQPVWKRIVVIAAGPAVNIVIALVLIFGIYAVKGQPEAKTSSSIGVIQKGSPAAGQLKRGDRIISVDGVTGTPERLRAQIGTHRCAGAQVKGCRAATPARFVIERDGAQLNLAITPRYSTADKRPLVGFSYAGVRTYSHVGVGEAARKSVAKNWEVTEDTVKAIGRLFYSEKARKEVSGVVGSYEVTQQSFKFDTVQAIFVLALISLSLAVINLFPFLPLDGGHIFWALAEKIRRRPVPFWVLERVSMVGFLLVAFLFVIGLTNDIDRLRNDAFNVGP